MKLATSPAPARFQLQSRFGLDDFWVLQGDDARRLEEVALHARKHYFFPILTDEGDMKRRFTRLANQWRRETVFMSSVHDMAMNQAYQHIIGMGSDVIPIILNELRHREDHWFWALYALTGVDPIPPSDRGNIHKMTLAWLRWGERNDYL